MLVGVSHNFNVISLILQLNININEAKQTVSQSATVLVEENANDSAATLSPTPADYSSQER